MTLPIQPVQLGSTGVVASDLQQFLDNLLKGSELRQREGQLQNEKERLKLEQQKYKDAQQQHDQEKAQLAQVGEIARNLFLGMQAPSILPAGSLPGAAGASDVNLGPQSPLAQMVQGLPPEAVPQLLPLLQQMGTLQGTAANTQGQVLANRSAAQQQADSVAIDRLVSGLETGPLTRQSVGRTLLRVAAIDPAKAQQLSGPLGSLVSGGGYTPHLNENGTVSWVPNEPGGIAGAPLQPKPGDVDQRTAGGYARRIFEAHATMTRIEQQYPGMAQAVDEVVRSLRGVGSIPVYGKALEQLLTREQHDRVDQRGPYREFLLYLQARADFANAVLRKESKSSVTASDIDNETTPYVPLMGTGEETTAAAQERRVRLGLQYVDQSGPEFHPERLSETARPYYLRIVTGHPDPPPPPPLQQRPGESVRRQQMVGPR